MPNEELKKLAEIAARLRESSESVGGWPIMEEAAMALESVGAIQQEVETLREAQDIAERAIGLAIFRLKPVVSVPATERAGIALEMLEGGREKLRALKQHTGENGETP